MHAGHEAVGDAADQGVLSVGQRVGGRQCPPPLLDNQVLPTHRFAVVGVGGPGHLAIQFLTRWGSRVTAISTTSAKRADAERFGHTDFIAAGEAGALYRLPTRSTGIVGSAGQTRQTIDFAARHDIRPQVQAFRPRTSNRHWSRSAWGASASAPSGGCE
ncbi:hypothetical protein [Streptomyces sp. NPDC088254]|uniref:hypothetical protein n=1 Tax=Streptomyces sp. NPDC088254 TaxID=3365847 RepID=UPI003828CBE4